MLMITYFIATILEWGFISGIICGMIGTCIFLLYLYVAEKYDIYTERKRKEKECVEEREEQETEEKENEMNKTRNIIEQIENGDMNYYGKFVKKNIAFAIRWYRFGANNPMCKNRKNKEYCQFMLGTIYINEHSIKNNLKKALKWFKLSAKNGNPKSQYILGTMYKMGKGCECNQGTACRWFKKSADTNNPDAQYELGEMYRRNGLCKQAKKMLIKSLENKILDHDKSLCALELARLYIKSHTRCDYNPGKQCNLKQDFVEALFWYNKSIIIGNTDAYNELQKYVKKNPHIIKMAEEIRESRTNKILSKFFIKDILGIIHGYL